jgi:uncharacterized protein (DUF1499 family)
MKMLLTILATLGGVVVLVLVALFVAARLSGRPSAVGDPAAELSPCPDKPNCVSSLSRDPIHAIAPLRYSGSPAEARARLGGVLRELERASIVTESEEYLHVEFRSALFRFVDDAEFRFDTTEQLIHFRSASRLGRSDLGVNRKRMERIRNAFNARGGR